MDKRWGKRCWYTSHSVTVETFQFSYVTCGCEGWILLFFYTKVSIKLPFLCTEISLVSWSLHAMPYRRVVTPMQATLSMWAHKWIPQPIFIFLTALSLMTIYRSVTVCGSLTHAAALTVTLWHDWQRGWGETSQDPLTGWQPTTTTRLIWCRCVFRRSTEGLMHAWQRETGISALTSCTPLVSNGVLCFA